MLEYHTEKEKNQLIGLGIILGILLFLTCFLTAHDYMVTKEYNEVVEEYNKCNNVCPRYNEYVVDDINVQWALPEEFKRLE